MQGRARRFVPAVVTVLVHAALLAGLLALRPKPPPAAPVEVLPLTWIAREPPPLPSLAPPGAGLSLPAPDVTLRLPEAPVYAAPAPSLPLPLGEYVACGLGRTLNEEQRARCDEMRAEIHARPDVAPNREYDLMLEQRFARAKEIEDAPKLLPCFTPVGPNPFCFLAGAFGLIEMKPGTYAPSGPPENPLARTVFPYRPEQRLLP